MRHGYVNGNWTHHKAPKFYLNEILRNGDIVVVSVMASVPFLGKNSFSKTSFRSF